MTNAVDDVDLPAVFWDKMPPNKDNADLAAINALIDEQTPAERAESHKVQEDIVLLVLSKKVRRQDGAGLNRSFICRIKAMKLLRLASSTGRNSIFGKQA